MSSRTKSTSMTMRTVVHDHVMKIETIVLELVYFQFPSAYVFQDRYVLQLCLSDKYNPIYKTESYI